MEPLFNIKGWFKNGLHDKTNIIHAISGIYYEKHLFILTLRNNICLYNKMTKIAGAQALPTPTPTTTATKQPTLCIPHTTAAKREL